MWDQTKVDRPVIDAVTLDTLTVGAHARVSVILGGRALHRRLLSLGLRVGSVIEVLHHRGRGVVVASVGNRIALGAGVAEKLLVVPLSSAQDV
jgi:ferrous iron transport protein A